MKVNNSKMWGRGIEFISDALNLSITDLPHNDSQSVYIIKTYMRKSIWPVCDIVLIGY